MTSAEHEQMVTRVIEGGLRTPEALPSAETFRAMREAEESAALAEFDGFAVSTVEADGVPLLSVIPEDRPPLRTVVYFHGGGYLWMTARTHLPVLVAIVRRHRGALSRSRLPARPEHPFPAAVEDAVTAYRWLLAEGNAAGDDCLRRRLRRRGTGAGGTGRAA